MNTEKFKLLLTWTIITLTMLMAAFLFMPEFHKYYPIFLRSNLVGFWAITTIFSVIGLCLSIKNLPNLILKVLFAGFNILIGGFYGLNWILGMPSGNF